MNIFLTGSENSGKSWVIDRVLEQYGAGAAGFRTIQKKTDEDKLCGIYITDLSRINEPLSAKNRIGSCTTEKIPICYNEVFETAGVSSLEIAPEPDIYIMDELGVMEEHCEKFKRSVIKCLDSGINVLGVIKKKNSDFLDSIRARRDIILLDLDIMSQKTALKKIKEYLY